MTNQEKAQLMFEITQLAQNPVFTAQDRYKIAGDILENINGLSLNDEDFWKIQESVAVCHREAKKEKLEIHPGQAAQLVEDGVSVWEATATLKEAE